MKEMWKSNRDLILLVLVCAGLGGLVFEGGRFLVGVLKWPMLIALVTGIFFAIGNDGYHAIKRLVRDKLIPWLRGRF